MEKTINSLVAKAEASNSAVEALQFTQAALNIANALRVQADTDQQAKKSLTEFQIKHMVSRFLGWRLPENFRPDCGIHFDADAAKKMNPSNHRYEPVGTNLFDADQAEAMIRYLLEGLP